MMEGPKKFGVDAIFFEILYVIRLSFLEDYKMPAK